MKLTKKARRLIRLEYNRELVENLMETFERSYETLVRWKYSNNTPFYKKLHKGPFLHIMGMTEEEAFEPHIENKKTKK